MSVKGEQQIYFLIAVLLLPICGESTIRDMFVFTDLSYHEARIVKSLAAKFNLRVSSMAVANTISVGHGSEKT